MDGGNKTQRLYRYDCNYVLSKLIVDNGLKDLWIDRIYRVYTDIEIANNTKINHIMISFTDHCNGVSLDTLPSKTKIGKG